jgi:hypothetical protein
MTDVLLHVVLVSFHEHVSQEVRAAKLAGYQSLGEACGGRAAGILLWRADWNLDQRKNFHLVEIGLFSNDDALQHFRTHPSHVAFGKDMSALADWVVGDISTKMTGFD